MYHVYKKEKALEVDETKLERERKAERGRCSSDVLCVGDLGHGEGAAMGASPIVAHRVTKSNDVEFQVEPALWETCRLCLSRSDYLQCIR